MDPLALAAVVGLAFVGKQMSDNTDVPKSQKPVESTIRKADESFINDDDPRLRGNFGYEKREMSNFADVTQYGSRHVYGQPVYSLSNRESISNTMKNLNPNPWTRVGPGVGVGPNVPSYGGYQQLAREMPTNVNEHRLTQLPGRVQAPPAAPVPTQEIGTIVSKNRPDKDYYRGPAKGSAVLRAPAARPRYARMRYTTLKEQTIKRSDDITGGPRYIVDSAYIVTGNQSMDRTNNRSKPDRMANPGQMNVLADPLGANGAITTLKPDDNSNRPVVAGGALISSGYIRSGIQEANPFKDSRDFRTDNLDIAKQQLAENVYNHPLS